jgi:hypothetical protein
MYGYPGRPVLPERKVKQNPLSFRLGNERIEKNSSEPEG